MRYSFTKKSQRRRIHFPSNCTRPNSNSKHDKTESPLTESLNSMASNKGGSNDKARMQAKLRQKSNIVGEGAATSAAKPGPFSLNDLLIQLPLIQDTLRTESSLLQDETTQECLPYLTSTHDTGNGPKNYNTYGLPCLERGEHVQYLQDSLEEHSSRMTALDASRAWILYWALAGLSLLGEDITLYHDR